MTRLKLSIVAYHIPSDKIFIIETHEELKFYESIIYISDDKSEIFKSVIQIGIL